MDWHYHRSGSPGDGNERIHHWLRNPGRHCNSRRHRNPRVLRHASGPKRHRLPPTLAITWAKGTVLINVTLDAQGRATGAGVERSSGHLLLDLAAKRSVLEKWQFDVSHCAHTFPATHQVAMEYRNEEYE